MANRFDVAVARIRQRLGEFAAVSIVYHRGDTALPLPSGCWVGRTAFRTSDQLGTSRLEWSERDYLIPKDLLVFDSVKVEPQEHDWIEEVFTVPDGTREYELLAPNDEPVWRYSDPQHTIYRVHTKAKKTFV